MKHDAPDRFLETIRMSNGCFAAAGRSSATREAGIEMFWLSAAGAEVVLRKRTNHRERAFRRRFGNGISWVNIPRIRSANKIGATTTSTVSVPKICRSFGTVSVAVVAGPAGGTAVDGASSGRRTGLCLGVAALIN